jgi:DNA-directed RNA polymerase subunit RPC12/RpoP
MKDTCIRCGKPFRSVDTIKADEAITAIKERLNEDR